MAEINIVVRSNGDFEYFPGLCHARRGEPITWRANGPWSIQFNGETPLDSVSVHGPADKAVESRVRSDAARGTYHDAGAVLHEGQIYLDAGCPTIIIG